MNVRLFDTVPQAAEAAAMLLADHIIRKPAAKLGLATGSTPVPIYRILVRMCADGLLDFSDVSTYNLDEYVGIADDHPCSYHRYMQENLFSGINIKACNTHLPCGSAADVNTACRQYEEKVSAAGRMDVQLLGIGDNGHIGFNEPSDRFVYECNIIALSDRTIQANRRFFSAGEAVPSEAITVGIGGIMQAEALVMLATGRHKAEAVKGMLTGDITPSCPASIIRLHHNVTVLLDREAAALL